MDKKRILELRGTAANIEPATHIGKNGVTDSLIEEINRQLKDNKLIKVKILKSAMESMPREEIANKLAAKDRRRAHRGQGQHRGAIQAVDFNGAFLSAGYLTTVTQGRQITL